MGERSSDSNESVEEPLLSQGERVDNFRVTRRIGRGGMGEVYLARDTRLGRKVALKVLRPRALGDRVAVERFVFEARVTARFNHPHIVTVYSVGQHRGCPYVALEHLDGQNLRQRMVERRLSLRETLRVGLAIAAALEEAHRHNVLHRDLKPSNVQLPRDGRIRVMDFGVATLLRPATGPAPLYADDGEVTPPTPSDPRMMEAEAIAPDRVPGTPRYMAPERWRRAPSTPAADVWSLGVILWELLADRHPYDTDDLGALCARVLAPTAAPPLPAEVDAPPELVELVAACLDKDPEGRPSARDVRLTLDGLLGEARPPTPAGAEGPFRGLLPFGERHAGLFFGREEEVAAFLERLREEPVLPVVGPSGAGKTSFVLAGVVPRLREQGRWLLVSTRPGRSPFTALASRVGEAAAAADETGLVEAGAPWADVGRLAAELAASPERLPMLLQELAEASGQRVLLFVDQLEELYSLVPEDGTRRAFLDAICAGSDDPLGPVRVIFALRDDSLVRVAETATARDALGHIVVLRSPEPEALEAIVTRPVEVAGYSYEDPSLPAEMVAAVRGEPACLPLLQFACVRLWERRDEGARALTRTAYEEMGGVEGALARHADEVVDAMTPPQVALARALLMRLLTGEGGRRLMTRGDLLEGLGLEAGEVLDRLVGGRTVLVRRAREGEVEGSEIELVHESLVRSWRRLARWLEESREEVSFLNELGQAADLWVRRGSRDDEVWAGDALQEALIRAARCTTVPERVGLFLERGRRREERRRRARVALVAGAMVTLAAVAAVLTILFQQARTSRARAEEQRAVAEAQRSRAEEERRIAEDERAEAEREGARAAALRGDLFEARAKLRLSLEARDTPLARALWWTVSGGPLVWSKGLGSVVYDAALSPDGGTVAVGCQNRTVVLVDVETLRQRVLRGHQDHVLSVAFDPAGERLASSSWSGEVRLWDLARGTAKALSEAGPAVRELAFSPDGATLAGACADDVARLWDLRAGGLAATLEGHEASVWGVAWSPDGRSLVTGSGDRTLRLWSAAGGPARRVLTGHSETVTRVAWSPDGRSVASGSFDRTVRLWDAESGELRRVLRGHTAPVRGVAWSADGTLLASGSYDSTVRLWRLPDGDEAGVLRGHEEQVREVAFASSGPRLVSGGLDRTVRLWSVDRAGAAGRSSGREGRGDGGLAWSPDGSSIATGGEDDTVEIREARTGRRLRSYHGHEGWVMAVAWSPDGRVVASGSHDSTVRLFDAEDGTELLALRGHTSPVRDVRFGPRGALVASAGTDRTVRLWDARTGAAIHVYYGHEQEIVGLAFSPSGDLLASASYDGTVRLWDVERGEARGVLRGHEGCVYGVAFSPDGRQIASAGCDRTVRLWPVEGRGARAAGRVLGTHEGRVTSLDFDPSGRRVAAPDATGEVRIWDLDGGEPLVLRGHRDDVLFARFDPAGRRVATTGTDGTVRLWDAATGEPLWRTILVLSDPPELASHEGWVDIDGGGGSGPPPSSAWRRAVEERARLAAEERVGVGLCLWGRDGALALWDRGADREVAGAPVSGLVALRAVPGGCLALADGRALLLRGGGAPRELATGATAIAAEGDRILVAAGRDVLVLDARGEGGARRVPADRDVTALASVDGALALGFRDGSLELVPEEGPAEAPAFSFEQPVPSPVESLAAGPERTLVAGFADGLLGIWSLDSGARLHDTRLHGAVTSLLLVGHRIVAASELGDHAVVDLGVFFRDYCDLMREVWREVPVVWSEGRPVPRPPPALGDHPCAEPAPTPTRPAGR